MTALSTCTIITTIKGSYQKEPNHKVKRGQVEISGSFFYPSVIFYLTTLLFTHIFYIDFMENNNKNHKPLSSFTRLLKPNKVLLGVNVIKTGLRGVPLKSSGECGLS